MMPEMALACGGLVSRDGSNVQSEKLTAALIYEPQPGGGRERLVLQLSYRVNQGGSVPNFGWVMPVPGKPEVAPAPTDIFSRLNKATTPKKNYLEKLFEPFEVKSFEATSKGIGAGALGGGSVTVVSQTRVGAFDVTVVSATEQTALTEWANRNGYTTTMLGTDAVRDYVAAGWFFVLSKLAAADNGGANPNGLALGQSQPVLLSFDTPQAVYPWRLAAYGPDGKLASARVLPVQAYLLQKETKLAPKNNVPGLELRYAEQLESSQSAELLKELPGDNNRPYFLSLYSGAVTAANFQAADLNLSKASDQSELNSGKLSGGEWVLAILVTLFFAELAILLTLLVIFTSSLSGIIIGLLFVAVAIAFVVSRRSRPIALIILTALNFILGLGTTVGAIAISPETTPLIVLISLVPMAAFLAWAIRYAFAKRRTVSAKT